jgi:hypothetical protein
VPATSLKGLRVYLVEDDAMATTSYLCGRNRALKRFFAAHLTMSVKGQKRTLFDRLKDVCFWG